MSWIQGDSPISFPSLGININPPAGFAIGSFEFRFYGLLIALGLTLAYVYGMRRRKDFGLTSDLILDGVLWIVPFALICTRAYYCIFAWDEFKDNPISVLYIWNGGLAIYGGVIGAAIGIIVYCKIKKLSIPMALDITSMGFLIGQSIGRWGNFFNREAFGAETESFLRMGLSKVVTENGIFHINGYRYYHPTFLYESVWNALGFVLLHFLSKKRKFDGQIALCYAAWYGLGRFFIEGLRTDSLYIGSFRVSQLLAAVSCLAAVGILVWMHFRHPDPANLYVNRISKTEEE